MRHPPRARHIVLLGALVIGWTADASADSFLSWPVVGSKTAARVGPEPYTEQHYPPQRLANVPARAIHAIKSTGSVIVGLEVLQRVHSASRDSPKVARDFHKRLIKLANDSGDPRYQLLRGANMVLYHPMSKRGVQLTREAVDQLSQDSAARLVGALTIAQRESRGLRFGYRWEVKSKLKREAATLFNLAQRLEATSNRPRKLVRQAIEEVREYFDYYPGYEGLIEPHTGSSP